MEAERFSDQLRRVVDASGRSRYAICKAIGLPQSAMSRFMTGKGGLSMDTLDKLSSSKVSAAVGYIASSCCTSLSV
jgi:hypothetical protein